jgi:general secretion pathway protein G
MQRRKLGRINFRRQGGFTFLEVIVVVAIIVLLATLIIPRLSGRMDQAKKDKTLVQIKALEQALELYRLDNGFYPTTEQGLKALVEKPDSEPEPKKWKKYIDVLPKDSWGHDFVYLQPGSYRDFDLLSWGLDGAEGGDDDITNWTKEEEENKK